MWISILGFSVGVILFRFKIVDWDPYQFFIVSTTVKETALAIVLSVLCSLTATILWTISTDTRRENRLAADLKLIQSVADPECLRSVFRELHHYSGYAHINHSMHVKLESLPDNESFFRVTIDYRYKRHVTPSNIVVKLHRITEASDIEDIPSPADEFKTSEITWAFDERDMEITPPHDLYTVSNMTYDNISVDLARREERSSESIIYFAKNPKTNNGKPDVYVSYTISFPIETQSVLVLSYDVPTHDATVHFDYVPLVNDIVVWSVDKVGLQEKPLIRDNDGTIHYSHNGWALPRDSYFFTWWKKT